MGQDGGACFLALSSGQSVIAALWMFSGTGLSLSTADTPGEGCVRVSANTAGAFALTAAVGAFSLMIVVHVQ